MRKAKEKRRADRFAIAVMMLVIALPSLFMLAVYLLMGEELFRMTILCIVGLVVGAGAALFVYQLALVVKHRKSAERHREATV